MRRAKDDNSIRIQQRDDQIAALQKDIALMLSDYQDLLDVKVQLDTELQAYQKMLEQEESRQNLILFWYRMYHRCTRGGGSILPPPNSQ